MAQKICPSCGTHQPDEYMFCAECGNKLGDAPVIQPATRPEPIETPAPVVMPEPEPVRVVPPPAAPKPVPPPAPAPVQSAPAVRPSRRVAWMLVHLSRAGGTNVPYAVPDEGLMIGTVGCAIAFPEDRTLSPRHAMVTVGERGLTIEDAGSVNGLFQKITADHILVDGDIFVCGDSVFRFSSDTSMLAPDDYKLYAAQDEVCPDGTVTKLLVGGVDGQVYPVGRRAVVIGREAADISCPEDRYMSRVHASVELVSAGLALKDKQSRNGTYIKTSGSIAVRDGDVILVGRQLLKVEAKAL
jgi:pSer/pThr/pTyr-binding forkhead associated (FHA) protein